uniref:U-scoloptoxin(05)-Er2a-like n=1 Tax=Styela clava TaxID=7725 RepID=UPI001939D305|nr:U-scoloptoxin(05)-Er2a-like [Styela clava]
MRQLLLLAFFIPAAIGLKCYICGIGDDPKCSDSQDPELRTCNKGDNACFYTKKKTDNVITSRGCADAKTTTQGTCFEFNGVQICTTVCNTDGCNHGSTLKSNMVFYMFMIVLSILLHQILV